MPHKEKGERDIAEYMRAINASRRRHRVFECEAASDEAADQLADLQCVIAETPAEGMFGVAMKLAIWNHSQFRKPEQIDPNEQCAIAAYDAAAALAGVDFEVTIRVVEGV